LANDRRESAASAFRRLFAAPVRQHSRQGPPLPARVRGLWAANRDATACLWESTDILVRRNSRNADANRFSLHAGNFQPAVPDQNCPSDTHQPPSTANTWPVTNLASSDIK